jgi:hypothetical protein
MHKLEKIKVNKSSKPGKTPRLSFSEESDDYEFDDKYYNSKMKVNCICPKCGEQHVMAFHWIGRGTPRKYCPSCKSGSDV